MRHVAVQPMLINWRMVAQKSRFVMCGDDFQPLDEATQGVLEQILLPPDTFDDAQHFLALTGIDALTLFPDQQGLKEKRETEKAQYLKTLGNYQKSRKG